MQDEGTEELPYLKAWHVEQMRKLSTTTGRLSQHAIPDIAQ